MQSICVSTDGVLGMVLGHTANNKQFRLLFSLIFLGTFRLLCLILRDQIFFFCLTKRDQIISL
jgi:hypothetical protein